MSEPRQRASSVAVTALTDLPRVRPYAALLGRSWFAICLLVAGCLAGRGLWAGLSAPRAGASAEAAARTRPIEQVRVGQRVWVGGAGGSATRVDPRTWRLLRLRALLRWEDGTPDDVNVETLRPPDWLAAHRAQVGAEVPLPLDLEEMGLPAGLTAEVLADEPCPAIAAGPGRVVLTTVNHLNADVRELTVEDGRGRRERIRPTGLHKFFREPEGDWASAEELAPGQRLRGRSGPLTVVANARVAGVHRVYNMTVEDDHVFHVSALGALAHNNNCAQPPGPRGLAGRAQLPGEVPLGSPRLPGHHNAVVSIVGKDGSIREVRQLTSAGQTWFESLWPRWKGLSSHTEARAATRLPLKPGEKMVILGEKPPCPSCKGYMNRAAQVYEADIQYQWWDKGKLLIWEAKRGR
jgi:hypothetical protein